MKKNYLQPSITMVEVKIEKGFATSGYELQQFEYEPDTDNDGNTAW